MFLLHVCIIQQSTCEDYIGCKKLFVFLPLLLELFKVCREPGCGDNVDVANIVCSRKGACMTITATCDSNHVTKVQYLTINDNNSVVSFTLSVVVITYGWHWQIYGTCNQYHYWYIHISDRASC